MPSPPSFSPSDSSGELEKTFRTLVDSISDYAIFTLDPNGVVKSWNRGAEVIKGYTAQDIIGQHFSTFYTAEAKAKGWPQQELEIAIREGRLEDEGWRVRKDGSRFWANVIITAIYDSAGHLTGFGKVTRDMTEKHRNLEKLRRSEETFRLLVQNVKDYAIFMLDTGGNIVSWNAGAAKIKGYSRADILGCHFSTFYLPEDVATGKPQRELEIAQKLGRMQQEGWRVRKDGSLFWAHATITAIYDDEDHLRGYANVTRDMTNERRLEEIETSARRMNEFLATLAHELRNPLAPINSATGVMEMLPGDEALVRKNLAVVRRQLTHLTRLVDDLLDVGRIAAGKLELQRSTIDAHEFLSAGVEAALPSIHAKAQHLNVDVPDRPIHVNADPTRLAQVVQNLLLNASKFAPIGSTIDLRLSTSASSALVEVSDKGCGIAPHMLDDIFNLFVQERLPGTHATGGLGIGLSLCRSIVEMHGGSISAQSAGSSTGSVFTFRVPAMRNPASEAVDHLPGKTTTGLRILIVDDNQDAADSMGLLLQMSGHSVDVVYTGQAAIASANQSAPQVVLIDLAMPGMDGFELIRALKSLGPLASTRFYALTGFGDQDTKARSAAAGFHGHLVKPVDIKVLGETLSRQN